MAAPPPTELPRWATGVGAQITHPSSGLQDSGFVPNTALGAGVQNWYWNLVYEWVEWLKNESGAANREANEFQTATAYSVLTSPAKFNGFACSPSGRVVGVGTSGNIWTSENGVPGATWTQRTPAASFSGDFNDVIYVGGSVNRFIAIGTGGEVQTSTSGTSWTHQTSGTIAALTRIGSDGTNLIIAAQPSIGQATMIKSTDAVTWTAVGQVNSGDFFPHSLVYGGGVWVVGGNATVASRDTTLFTSINNGTTWLPVILSSGPVINSTEITVGVNNVQGTFVAIAQSGTTSRMIKSFNGLTWSAAGSIVQNGDNRVLACGSHVIIDEPREPRHFGQISTDGGLTFFEITTPGFGYGNCDRIQELRWNGDGPGLRQWYGCGFNGASDDRGKIMMSRHFTV